MTITKLLRHFFAVALFAALLAGAVRGREAAAAPTTASADARVLLTSDRDGPERMYSVGSDGSRLTPLFQTNTRLEPITVSREGDAIAYVAGEAADSGQGRLYVSRADGSGLRLVARWTDEAHFSPGGKLLAFTTQHGIRIVGSDGRGLRPLTSGAEETFDWSPDGKALVIVRAIDSKDRFAVVVKPLHGRQRVLARTGPNGEAGVGEYQPQWSPDGRWIGYVNREDAQRRNGVTLIRPNGTRRHRVVIGQSEEDSFSWSPDGRWLAYQDGKEIDYILPSGEWHKISVSALGPIAWSPNGKKLAFVVFAGNGADLHEDLAVASGNGKGLKRLHVAVSAMLDWSPLWSSDSKSIAFAGSNGGDPSQIWVVSGDGSGLRRLTNEGRNDVVGWTKLGPVLPPAAPLPPTEHVIAADTVSTATPVAALSADGPRVAFAVRSTATDCVRVLAWTPAESSLMRLGHLPAPCWASTEARVSPLALAGTRAAWVWAVADGSTCMFTIESATLDEPSPRILGESTGGASSELCNSGDIDHVRGDGDLLVFNDEPWHPSSLVRIGARTTTLRNDAQASPVDSVSARLIAVRNPGAVTLLDEDGRLVRTIPFSPADVYGARLDAGHLVVARSDTVESYDVASGAREASQPLAAGYQLADADGGIAVLRRAGTVILLRLSDGHSLTIAPGGAPVLADLEPPGLYYSYSTADGGGRVVFVPRTEIVRQLGGAS